MKTFTKLNAALEPIDKAATDHVAILDNDTGLMWPVANVSEKRLEHAEAIAACAALALGDKADWRLPTIQELLTLVDYERVDPAINVDAFPKCKPNFYWSSSPYVGSSGFAWYVSFANGYSLIGLRHYVGFVRAVRGPVAASQ